MKDNNLATEDGEPLPPTFGPEGRASQPDWLGPMLQGQALVPSTAADSWIDWTYGPIDLSAKPE
jgi:hypothetical protein